MLQVFYHSTEEFAPLLRQLGCRRFLLVCGGSFRKLPPSVQAIYEQNRDQCTVFGGFSPNPKYEEVVAGVDLYRASGCDCVVAVGGGSAMDVAKCIKLFAKMDPATCYLEQPYRDPGIPLIALPTTAGSGSESTRHAVIYKNGEKQSVSDRIILPDAVFLIPQVLKTLPVYQKKCTLLDALCQGIESFWSVKSTPESQAHALAAIRGILPNAAAYVCQAPSDEVCGAIMEASNQAGQAIDTTSTTAPHAMSYKLTTLYGLPHGHSVAISLLPVWEYTEKHMQDGCSDPRGAEHLRQTLDALPLTVNEFAGLLEELEITGPVLRPGAEPDVLAAAVNTGRLKNHPVTLTAQTLTALYEGILQK